MGAQPKKKTSHSKKNMRRSHDRVAVGALVHCSHCRRPHRAHHMCPNCGYYAGREVVAEEPVTPATS
jgi:large subunit ribosomal protein L32